MSSRATKRRRLTPPPEDEHDTAGKGSKKIQKSFFKSAAGWNLEQDYENRPRKGKKEKKNSNRLPIKTADGRVEQYQSLEGDNRDDDAASVESDGEWLEGREDEDATAEAAAERLRQDRRKEEEESNLPEPVQIHQAKEELAKIAMALNEDPEENVGAFKALAKIGQSRIQAIQKLTLATQLAVYKDVIPGYRIRPVAEDAPVEKLSKEVRKLRAFEQALVSNYQAYIKELAKWAKADIPATRQTGQSISSVAISCACTLVTAVPHFNFRNDLLKILVSKLSKRKIDADYVKCRRSLETLFVEDEEGRPSMEAVSLLTKMMKARGFAVDESVPNLFLHLRLLSEFAGKASQDRVDRERDPGAPPPQSRKSFKKEFRTKKERKMLKEQKAIEKDMQQADALVSHEERERMQSETLKLVFASYFRILKMRVPHLMGAVLEGLAKYAHLINQDFFGDLLEALKDLIRHAQEDAEDAEDVEGEQSQGAGGDDDDEEEEDDDDGPSRNTTREALLCTVTAFALLAGQDAHNSRAQLHLDLSHFVTHLFTSLPSFSMNPDLELTSKSLHIQPSAAAATRDNRVNLQTTTVLLLRCLTAVLLPAYQIRSVPPLRLAAFSKQLMSAALHVPDKSAQAVLALMQDVSHTHGKKIAALWRTEERKGDGTYNALSESVEGSNPFATTVWEGELLRRHFSPKVREGVKLLEKEISNA
ncbi:nucleolar complex-associated protein [Colletotrichum higginsianum]|uniref:Nucleolar complex-associated protein 3 n=2 Tax=Colletotrichum higginsianum TaxID=80884 RepID=H1VFS5_COLHI|nr:Nucleolar complex-associated protein [Colletotrichum higginsianum IMI 349063]OBR14093.1 Nucleolar complex-associated protein [Colletotrichum higginsianum IMI 349063]TID02026.1 Nucleolar complex-associated protein 3 [Colletotrichum higginsianum]CCF39078.1 nucleolar complex-associated protein [Colletotrichum higginsianum]